MVSECLTQVASEGDICVWRGFGDRVTRTLRRLDLLAMTIRTILAASYLWEVNEKCAIRIRHELRAGSRPELTRI